MMNRKRFLLEAMQKRLTYFRTDAFHSRQVRLQEIDLLAYNPLEIFLENLLEFASFDNIEFAIFCA
jgi:hypothetical protein